MLINRTHRSWFWGTLTACIIGAGCYLYTIRTLPDGAAGGSWQGLLFGIAGTACMIFAGLLSGRKSLPGARLGTVKWWLKAHIWLGLLSVPLILFHSGFRWGGPLEMVLMAVFFIVIGSGVLGLILQQSLPRIMSTVAPAQAIYEQIPVACARLRESADAVVSEACSAYLSGTTPEQAGASMGSMSMSMTMTMSMSLSLESLSEMMYSPEAELWAFFQSEVDPFLSPAATLRHPMANSTYASARISQYQGSLPARFSAALDEIRGACDERRQLLRQEQVHGWLHSWLNWHLPLSMALLILSVLHICFSVYY